MLISDRRTVEVFSVMQSAKPDADVTTGSWQSPPLWQKLSEGTDGTFVVSVENPLNESFTVALDCVNLPKSGSGGTQRG